MTRKAKLVEVQGDQEEYADLIGATGELQLHETDKSAELNWFSPKNRGDTLGLTRKTVTENGKKVVVSTRMGNKFTFQLI